MAEELPRSVRNVAMVGNKSATPSVARTLMPYAWYQIPGTWYVTAVLLPDSESLLVRNTLICA